jgi:very-short-patch-repair endonuclease
MSYKIIKTFARQMRKEPTPAERFFWSKVRNRRFDGLKFYRQYIIQHDEHERKKSFFIADFYCHTNKLVVELDGEYHQLPEQIEYDEIRTQILVKMGFTVLRFNNKTVLENWKDVAKKLKEHLNSPRD